jgi:hypothetical protein
LEGAFVRKLSILTVALVAGASSLGLLASGAHAATLTGPASGSETCHVTGTGRLNKTLTTAISHDRATVHLDAFGLCSGNVVNTPGGKPIDAASLDIHFRLARTTCDGAAALPLDTTKMFHDHIVWQQAQTFNHKVHYRTTTVTNAEALPGTFSAANDIETTRLADAFFGEKATLDMDAGSVSLNCQNRTITLNATLTVAPIS